MNGSSRFNRAALVAAVAMAFGATPLYAQSGSSASGAAGASSGSVAASAQGGSNSQQDPRNFTSRQGAVPSADRAAAEYDMNRYGTSGDATTGRSAADGSSFGGNGLTTESERGENHMRAGSDGVPEPTSPLSGTGASGAGRSGVGVHDDATTEYGAPAHARGTRGTSSIDEDRSSAPPSDTRTRAGVYSDAYGDAQSGSPADISRATGRADFGLGGPGRTGHDVQPTDMGPGSMRAQ